MQTVIRLTHKNFTQDNDERIMVEVRALVDKLEREGLIMPVVTEDAMSFGKHIAFVCED